MTVGTAVGRVRRLIPVVALLALVVGLAAAPAFADLQTATTVPSATASKKGGSGLPRTAIAVGFALAGGVLLVAGLRRPSASCKEPRSALAARCAELTAAEERIRLASGHHASVDATLRTALAEPEAHVPNGTLAPALRTLRREHHHARDQLTLARTAAADAQRQYDQARAAFPDKCGTYPPCVTPRSG